MVTHEVRLRRDGRDDERHVRLGERVAQLLVLAACHLDHLRIVERGLALAVNMRRHGSLIAWAKERHLFVRVDRATPWGNPFSSVTAAGCPRRLLLISVSSGLTATDQAARVELSQAA